MFLNVNSLNLDSSNTSSNNEITMLDETPSISPSPRNYIPKVLQLLSGIGETFKIKGSKIKKSILKSPNYNGEKYWSKLQVLVNNLKNSYNLIPICKLKKEDKDPSGNFGFIKINYPKKGLISKQTNLINDLLKILEKSNFSNSPKSVIRIINLLSRLQNLCSLINNMTIRMNKLLPKHTIKIKSCNKCKINNLYSYEMTAELVDGITLSQLLKKGISDDDLKKIELQLIYIAKTLSENKIYHNDFAPRNIMIKLQKQNIILNSHSKYKLIILDTYIPVIIDYDFIDNKPLHITGDENDFEIYSSDISKRNTKSYFIDLLDDWDNQNLKKINKINNISINKKNKIGGKKLDKKNKKKRKHIGINQKTGKLNKGYKYSGRKLKSGLSEIKKIK